MSTDEWLRLGRALLHQGLLSETTDGYPVLRLNALSREILRKQRNVQIESHDPESQKRLALIRTSAKRLVIIKPNLLPLKPEEEAVSVNVLQHLRNLRKRIADEQGVPPYVVFADVSLRAMAQQRPQRRSLFAVFKKAPPGVGSRKLEAYFTIFTDEIRAYCELHNLSIDLEPPSEQLEQKRTYVPAVNVNTPTRQLTLQLHRQGLSIEEIARERNLKPTTVAGYLAELIEAGEAVTVERLIRPERYTVIADALQQVGGDTHDKSGCYGLLRTFWEMRAQAS